MKRYKLLIPNSEDIVIEAFELKEDELPELNLQQEAFAFCEELWRSGSYSALYAIFWYLREKVKNKL